MSINTTEALRRLHIHDHVLCACIGNFLRDDIRCNELGSKENLIKAIHSTLYERIKILIELGYDDVQSEELDPEDSQFRELMVEFWRTYACQST